MPLRFLVEISCNGCGEVFIAQSGQLFASTSEAEEQAFTAGWEKMTFHSIWIYACPTCQEAGKKATAKGAF